MATEAQIDANRQNAQKSTGPKTAEGKAAVSQNAVKHGLFAVKTVIKGENSADYELLRNEMLAELAPSGMLESVLAERIVSLSWRLQRAERMHNEVIDVKIERESPYNDRFSSQQNDSAPNLILGWIVIKDLANSRVLERLELYERRIENSLYKTINRLKQYQVIRRIELDETGDDQPAQAIPIPIKDNRDEAVTRPAYKLSDLKKQSQFAAAHLTAKPLMKGDYNNKPAGRVEENKADQSQLHEPALPNGVGKRGKSSSIAAG